MKYFLFLLICPIFLFGETKEYTRFELKNVERDHIDDSFIVEICDHDYGWIYFYRFNKFKAELNLWDLEHDLMLFMIWNLPERIVCADMYD